jgi:hypothetical protein
MVKIVQGANHVKMEYALILQEQGKHGAHANAVQIASVQEENAIK